MRPPSSRQLALFVLVALGLLTTMATSQARWVVSDDLETVVESANASLHFEFEGDARTLAATQRVELVVEPADALGRSAFEGGRWSASTSVSTQTQAMTLVDDATVATVEWREVKVACPSSGRCTMTFDLVREGGEDTSIALKVSARALAFGAGSPPGGEAVQLRLVPR